MCDFINTRRVVYGDEGEKAVFVPVCKKCCRFVKAPATMRFNGEGEFNKEDNRVNCSKCGPSEMIFEGYF